MQVQVIYSTLVQLFVLSCSNASTMHVLCCCYAGNFCMLCNAVMLVQFVYSIFLMQVQLKITK